MNGKRRASINEFYQGIRGSVPHDIELESYTEETTKCKMRDVTNEIHRCMHHKLLQLHSTGRPAIRAYQPIPSS